jgi:S1-C subfamily serine protease
MKGNNLRPLYLVFAFLLVAVLACNLGGAETEEPPTTVPEEPTPFEEEPTLPPETSGEGAVTSLDGVRDATVQIEAQGTFIDPEFGLQVNAAGRGSGFIISPSGLAVTNNHVVTGAALLKVWVGGEGEARNAKILGVSECSDLAVIDIDGEGYPYLEWFQGTIDVGLDIYVAGFPLGDPEYTLTRGVISKAEADGETYWSSVPAVLEYDANANPGNSGGPVIDSDGNVVAVHYASNREARQAFGIARDAAQAVLDELESGLDVNSIGINGTAVISQDGTLSGIWVASVKSGSPADEAGIRAGDILYSLEGLVLATDGTMKDYCDILRTHDASDTLAIEVIRYATLEILEGQLNGRELEVVGTFGDAGDDTGDQTGGETGGETGETGTSSEPFFVEEFDQTLDNWSYFLMNGDESKMDLYTDSGRLVFDLGGEDLWVYVTYDDYTYTDVRIDAEAENLGRNNNNVSLICRYSDRGWYEFNIANNGLYNILIYDNTTESYERIADGGSTAIRSGRDVNTYTGVCSGDTLTLYINGVEVNSVQETRFRLKEGQVGLSVSSFDVLPINVEFGWVAISPP